MAESKKMMKREVAFMKSKGAPKSMLKHEQSEMKGMAKGGAFRASKIASKNAQTASWAWSSVSSICSSIRRRALADGEFPRLPILLLFLSLSATNLILIVTARSEAAHDSPKQA